MLSTHEGSAWVITGARHYRVRVILAGDYRDFFVAAAGASGALIGLLFVAVSVFPEQARQAPTRVAYHTQASTALLVFSNALVLSLAALVPGVGLGWWAVAISVGVVVFAAATARLIVAAARRGRGQWGLLGVVVTLLIIAGFEFSAGIRLIGDHTDLTAIRTLDYVVISYLGIGIARAWQLVSLRDSGLLSSLRILARGEDLARDNDDREAHQTGGTALPNP